MWSGLSARWKENLRQLFIGSGEGLKIFFLYQTVLLRDGQKMGTVESSSRFTMEWNNDTRRHALVFNK